MTRVSTMDTGMMSPSSTVDWTAAGDPVEDPALLLPAFPQRPFHFPAKRSARHPQSAAAPTLRPVLDDGVNVYTACVYPAARRRVRGRGRREYEYLLLLDPQRTTLPISSGRTNACDSSKTKTERSIDAVTDLAIATWTSVPLSEAVIDVAASTPLFNHLDRGAESLRLPSELRVDAMGASDAPTSSVVAGETVMAAWAPRSALLHCGDATAAAIPPTIDAQIRRAAQKARCSSPRPVPRRRESPRRRAGAAARQASPVRPRCTTRLAAMEVAHPHVPVSLLRAALLEPDVDEPAAAQLRLRCNNGTYDGGVLRGKRHGRGTFRWAVGDSYTGEWQHDQMHGDGTYEWADGRRYVGSMRHDELHGPGRYEYGPGGAVFVGRFRYDHIDGHGVFTAEDGTATSVVWRGVHPLDAVFQLNDFPDEPTSISGPAADSSVVVKRGDHHAVDPRTAAAAVALSEPASLLTDPGVDPQCVVCHDAVKTRAVVPCGHLCLCGPCADTGRVTLCPLCRVPVELLLELCS